MIDISSGGTAHPVGRVVATELKPSTPHQFHFWTARESSIGIGAIVRVEQTGRTVYGVDTDGFAYSDLMTPMHDVLGADGDPVAAGQEPTARAEIRLFTAAVLRQVPEEPLQPVPLGPVWLATDADVTSQTLTQIILEEGRKGTALLPSELLHELVRMGERAVETGRERVQQGVDRLVQASVDRLGPLRRAREEMSRLRSQLDHLESSLRSLESDRGVEAAAAGRSTHDDENDHETGPPRAEAGPQRSRREKSR